MLRVTCVDQPLRRQHARSHRPRRRTHDSCAWPISPASTSLLVSRRTMCRRHSGISRLPVFVILALANAFLPTARCNMPMVSGNNTHAAARTISPQTVFGYGPMALAWTVSRSAAARPALPSNSVAPGSCRPRLHQLRRTLQRGVARTHCGELASAAESHQRGEPGDLLLSGILISTHFQR